MAYISLIVLLRTYKLICIFQPQRHLWTFFIVLWYLNVWTKDGAGVNQIFFNTSLALVFHIYLFSMLNMLLTVIYYSHIQYNHNIHSTILHGTKLFKKEIILLFYSLPLNPPKMFRVYFHRTTKPRPLSATNTHIKALYFLQIWQKFTP